jgi:DNA-binding XRE family transcriptional regulator
MHLPNHLCRHRKRYALTQREIAQFLGVDPSTVSRVEAGAEPNALFALGCGYLFGEPLTEVFPSLVAQMRATVIPQLATFSIKVETEAGAAADLRRQFLAQIVARENEQVDRAGV